MRLAGTPAATARRSSPSETTSTPAPRAASVFSTALVGVGLHRIADEGIDIGEGLREHRVVALERCRRIAVEGRADGPGNVGNGHILGMEDAIAIVEVVHGIRSRSGPCRSGAAAARPGSGAKNLEERIEQEGAIFGRRLFLVLGCIPVDLVSRCAGGSRSPLRPQPLTATASAAARSARRPIFNALISMSSLRGRLRHGAANALSFLSLSRLRPSL